MDKLLITGAGGFIGKPTVELLLQNSDFEVHTTHTSEKSFINGCHCHICNLLEGEGLDLIQKIQPSHMLHLAWELPNGFEEHPSNIKWLSTSLMLLDKFSNTSGRRFVFAGSSSEYNKNGGRHAETNDYKKDLPNSLYGICKKSMTDIGVFMNKESNSAFCSARIFPVYGLEQGVFTNNKIRGSIIYAVNEIMNNRKAICKSPDTVWEFIHVNDVAICLKRLVASNVKGIVNICSSKPYAMREVFTAIGSILERPELVVFEDDYAPRHLVGDNTRLKTELGISPKVELEEGIKMVIDEYKAMQKKTKIFRCNSIVSNYLLKSIQI